MICPIMSNNAYNPEDHIIYQKECVKEKCAWWTSETRKWDKKKKEFTGMCVIRSLEK